MYCKFCQNGQSLKVGKLQITDWSAIKYILIFSIKSILLSALNFSQPKCKIKMRNTSLPYAKINLFQSVANFKEISSQIKYTICITVTSRYIQVRHDYLSHVNFSMANGITNPNLCQFVNSKQNDSICN